MLQCVRPCVVVAVVVLFRALVIRKVPLPGYDSRPVPEYSMHFNFGELANMRQMSRERDVGYVLGFAAAAWKKNHAYVSYQTPDMSNTKQSNIEMPLVCVLFALPFLRCFVLCAPLRGGLRRDVFLCNTYYIYICMYLFRGAGVDFGSFDILSDEQVRAGLKVYSNWPTFPQVHAGSTNNAIATGILDFLL